MSRIPLRWTPDPETGALLAQLRRTREPLDSILRRAIRLLAQADGHLDTSGRIRNTSRPGSQPIRGQAPGKRL